MFALSEQGWCFGVDAGEQETDDRFVPAMLKQDCAQCQGLDAELGAAAAAPRNDEALAWRPFRDRSSMFSA